LDQVDRCTPALRAQSSCLHRRRRRRARSSLPSSRSRTGRWLPTPAYCRLTTHLPADCETSSL
jgi:hypothetical protein